MNINSLYERRFAFLSQMWVRAAAARQAQTDGLIMSLDGVEITLRRGACYRNISGGTIGTVFIDRNRVDGGLLPQKTCWTDLNREDDEMWFQGVEGETGTPVTVEIINSWLLRDAPLNAW